MIEYMIRGLQRIVLRLLSHFLICAPQSFFISIYKVVSRDHLEALNTLEYKPVVVELMPFTF